MAAAAKKALADHLSRTGRTGTVEDGLFPSTYRVKWDIVGDPKVSILIPNKDHTDDLEKCLYSIWSKTEWENFEVIVIENNSTDPATFAYYKDAEKRYDGLQVVTWPQKGFNFSGINNFGRQAAQGEYLLLLNNDVEVRNGDWLTELLRQCAHPGGAAICGAELLLSRRDACSMRASSRVWAATRATATSTARRAAAAICSAPQRCRTSPPSRVPACWSRPACGTR